MDYAREFLIYRAQHDLSQTEFGKLIGLKQLAVSQIEHGNTNPREVTKMKFELLKEKERKENE
jgi:DNA-binding XRE family transcriptional regulator